MWARIQSTRPKSLRATPSLEQPPALRVLFYEELFPHHLEQAMINPELGHTVHFSPGSNDSIPGPAPLSALITHVQSDREVNVRVFGRAGGAWTRANVRLLQDREMAREGEPFVRYPDDVRREAGELEVAGAPVIDSGVKRQRLKEFYDKHLRGEIASRKLGVAGEVEYRDGGLMLLWVDSRGYKAQIVVPFEMIDSDADKGTIASNLCHGAVEEITHMRQQDGKKSSPQIPEVPPAPTTSQEAFGETEEEG